MSSSILSLVGRIDAAGAGGGDGDGGGGHNKIEKEEEETIEIRSRRWWSSSILLFPPHPPHFIHKIKTIDYGVIDVNSFPRTVNEILSQQRA